MHATNVLARDLARDNERLRARVAELESMLAAMQPDHVTVGEYQVDLGSGWYTRDGARAGHLTETELRLLACLAISPGVVVRFETIGAYVWPGYDLHAPTFDQLLRTNLSRLRAKLDGSPVEWVGMSTGSRHFQSARGVGIGLIP